MAHLQPSSESDDRTKVRYLDELLQLLLDQLRIQQPESDFLAAGNEIAARLAPLVAASIANDNARFLHVWRREALSVTYHSRGVGVRAGAVAGR